MLTLTSCPSCGWVCVCVCVCEEVSNVGGIPVPLLFLFSLVALIPIPSFPASHMSSLSFISNNLSSFCSLTLHSSPFRCLSFSPSFFQIASTLSLCLSAFCLPTLLEQRGTPGPHRCCLINSFHRVNQKNELLSLTWELSSMHEWKNDTNKLRGPSASVSQEEAKRIHWKKKRKRH